MNKRGVYSGLALALAFGVASQLRLVPGNAAIDAVQGLENLVVVTEDYAHTSPGCDAISVFNVNTGEPVYRGESRISPGRLAATTDFTTILATGATGVLPYSGLDNAPWMYLLRGDAADRDRGGLRAASVVASSRRSWGSLSCLTTRPCSSA